MDPSTTSLPVVVGIDGSKHAVQAAIWAIDEAISRDTQLRLLYVVDGESQDLDDDDYARARHALHAAWAAVEGQDRPVKIESDIRQGEPVAELVDASRAAAMVCLGAKGADDSAPRQRGSTAADVAQSAFSSVAVVRHRHGHIAGRWIVAVLDESPSARGVLPTAMDEAAEREAPVLALTPWTARSPAGDRTGLRASLERYLADADDDASTKVCVLPAPEDIDCLLAQSADIDQLVIVGPSDSDRIDELVGPKARKILKKTNCSVLVVRNGTDR